MERKGGNHAVAVTSETVRTALGAVQTLTIEEEKVLRMRHGAFSRDSDAVLSWAGAGTELMDELLMIEMDLFRSSRRQTARALPISSKAKDKIVRALRKKR